MVETEIKPRQFLVVAKEFQTGFLWRALWLSKEAFLLTSLSEALVRDGRADAELIIRFLKESDTQALRIGRVASIVFGKPFEVHSMLNKTAVAIHSNGKIEEIQIANQTPSNINVRLILKLEAVATLSKREDGVRLFHDGNATTSHARKFTEFFRVLEAGFGLKGSRLEGPLVNFLSSGLFPIDKRKWEHLKALRDKLSHAYQCDEIAFEADTMKEIGLMQMLAADVLVHKDAWGTKESKRISVSSFGVYKTLDGLVALGEGFPLEVQARFFDPVTGLPMHLMAEKYSDRYRRYAEFVVRKLAQTKQA